MTIYRRFPLPAAAASEFVQIAATWTHIRPSSTMDSVIAAHVWQNQYMNEFGASEVWPTQNAYDTNSPTWTNLDPFVTDMVDAGATELAIDLGMCMAYQRRTQPGTNETRMDSSKFAEFADMCAQVADRFDGTGGRPYVKWFPVWSEMKDFYDNVNNHYDWVLFATFFNTVYDAVKAVRPDAQVGGPYLIIESGQGSWSHGPTAYTFPGGSLDSRVISNIDYFVANCTYDFICCDGGIENQFGTAMPNDPMEQVGKFTRFWQYVRTLDATCPLFWIETYVNEAKNSPWNYTIDQRSDLYVELARQTQQNVSNPGNIVYYTWFHPDYKPQVVDTAGEPAGPFSWANTENEYFRGLVDDWHATGT